MTNQQILEKTIQKAIDGGWKERDGNKLHVDENGSIYILIKGSAIRAFGYQTSLERIIFNHEFCKALWGEEPYENKSDNYLVRDGRKAWMVHLQQMVIADDPIAYLGENI